ncbi:MAG: type VI secretion system membrane subunit TssM [Gammaproteobacteria bacterium]
MKPTTLNALKKQIVPFIFIAISSVFIWYVGPLLAIANQIPLAQPEKRIYIIAAIFLIWLLKVIFLDSMPETPKTSNPTLPAEFVKKLQLLKGRFQGALNFLNKTVINKNGVNVSLNKLPWYLLIGTESSGKTTLLANSNINFILSKQFKKENSSNIYYSNTCDWWATRDLVLVDVPNNYFIPCQKPADKNQQTTQAAPTLWAALLNLIKSTPGHNQLNGVVIALNLPEIMKRSSAQKKSALIPELKRRILELRAAFGPALPFHIVITKCDLLPGFLDFFGESSGDELAQAWGVTLPMLSAKEKLLDVFSHRFNVLIKRLNKQLIWRLHQERNTNVRPYIKDFPLHVERLKENLMQILKALMIPDLRLHSVYLTSATQSSTDESGNYIHGVSSNASHQALQIMRAPVMPSRAYFVRQCILQGLLHSIDHRPASTKDYSWQKRTVYAASLSTIVLAAILLGQDFQHSVKKAYSIQSDLGQYQLYMQQPNQNNDRLVKALPLLFGLQQAANSSHQLSRLQNALSFYSNKSEQTANSVYLKALQTIVIPEVKNYLEKYLRHAANKNPVPVYTALKAYLMLADADNRQANFIANTLNKIISTPMNKQALTELTSHIDAALSQNAIAIDLDQDLIATVRKQLVNLPSTELGFVILKNIDTNNADSEIGLGTNFGNPPVFISKRVANRIPNMFTVANFNNVLNTEIRTSTNEALSGNWVLGALTPSANQVSAETLTTQIYNQYIANYIDIWESQLANIQPYTPKNLLQIDEMIQNLTSNNSPLLQLLQTIKQNTSLMPIITASPKFQALNTLLDGADNKQQSPLYQVFSTLQQLHVYLQSILSAPNVSNAAFTAAALRMQNPNQDAIAATHQLAMQSPEPLKTWLNNIANESWNFILQENAQYVEAAWQNEIIPTYNTEIANHYPFSQNSNQEVNLQQFTTFLGHRGKLAQFYQAYLKNYVNENDNQWTWKIVDNQKIPFSDALLASLQHASQIQSAFFQDGSNKLSIDFTLQPVELEANSKSFNLNINGQLISYKKNSQRFVRALSWPGNFSAHASSINFVTPKNQLVGNTIKGDWAWFKLVNNATQTVNSRKELMLTFSADGHMAKCLLLTSGHMNPFLPMNLTRFELPQDLMG